MLTTYRKINLKTLSKERLKEFKEPTLPKEIDRYLENKYCFYVIYKIKSIIN
jgi:hypothetical protein